MKQLVVLLVFVAMAMASAEDCGPLQRLKVKQQWAHAYGTGHERIDFGQSLWRTVFNIDPDSRKLFEHVRGDNIHHPEFKAHVARVLGGLDMCFSLLDDEDTLQAQLAHLKEQHKARSIPANYFEVFGQALLDVVPAKLGRSFDYDAWKACYSVVAHGIAGE